MPRIPLGISGSSKTGEPVLPPVSADPTGFNSVNNNGETILTITNAGVVTHTLSVMLTATVDGQPVNPRTYTITAGQTIIAGPYPTWWYGTTLLLNADSSDLQLSAFRPGTGLPAPASTTPFTLSGNVLIADLAYAGLSLSGNVLVVDTALTPTTVDGNALVATV